MYHDATLGVSGDVVIVSSTISQVTLHVKSDQTMPDAGTTCL